MSAPAPNLADLYRQIVLDHSRNPRNHRRPAQFDHDAEGHNRLCGDKVRVYLRIAHDRLEEVACETSGCAICLASGSLMTENTQARPVHEALAVIQEFEDALSTGDGTLSGDLAALSGVSQYPSRIRCATLPWKTLRAALASSPVTVTTE